MNCMVAGHNRVDADDDEGERHNEVIQAPDGRCGPAPATMGQVERGAVCLVLKPPSQGERKVEVGSSLRILKE
eukprot:SAG31_NODE_3085_length_4696_cov_2.976289_1_plen_73_part_00